MMTVEVFAPAKINLTLHVTGQREDGYHLLDSLVAFANVGDTVEVEHADEVSLSVEGPFAADVPTDGSNLVLRAADLVGEGRGARITLTKRLPVASGIGGGSADAAATVRALCELWDLPWPDESKLVKLGADVPVCMRSGLTRMRGVGERLEHLGVTPEMGLILVNPGISVPTHVVFQALENKSNEAMEEPANTVPAFDKWIEWLSRQRNDLEAPAVSAFPVIGEVLDELRALPACRLARMSGSGATCFAVFDDDTMINGVAELHERHPDWWVVDAAGLLFCFEQSTTFA